MADITTALTGYPAVIDTRTTLTDGSSGSEIVAAHPNGSDSAVIAVQTELGTDPAGSATDLKTRLAVAHNDAGAVTVGTAASLVGIVPFNRGGLGQTVASTTNTANGYLVGFANSVLQAVTLTGSNGITAAATSGTWTISLDNTSKLSGDVVQMVYASVTGATTTNGTVPSTNVPITTAHGSGFGLSVDIKPTSTANKIYCLASVVGSNDSGVLNGVGLFLGGSSSAVTAFPVVSGAASNIGGGQYLWRATTVSEATTTYALRIGGSAGTFTLNGQGAGGLWANEITSSIMVWEVEN